MVKMSAKTLAAALKDNLGNNGKFANSGGIDALANELTAKDWSDIIATVSELWRTALLDEGRAALTRSDVSPDAHFNAPSEGD